MRTLGSSPHLGNSTTSPPRSNRLLAVGLTVALGLAISMGSAGPAVAKGPPDRAYYGATDIDCYVGNSGSTIGAYVDAQMGLKPGKNNALRRMEIKYRLIHADTTPGLGWSKPGYKVYAGRTAKWSDKKHWTLTGKDLKTNRENMGGDYNVEVQFKWIRQGAWPNWKKTVVYRMDESVCSGGTWG